MFGVDAGILLFVLLLFFVCCFFLCSFFLLIILRLLLHLLIILGQRRRRLRIITMFRLRLLLIWFIVLRCLLIIIRLPALILCFFISKNETHKCNFIVYWKFKKDLEKQGLFLTNLYLKLIFTNFHSCPFLLNF